MGIPFFGGVCHDLSKRFKKVHLDVFLEKVIVHIQIIPALCHQDAVNYNFLGWIVHLGETFPISM